MQEIEIELSDWVFNAIHEKGGEILTISRDYFRLRKPLERRLYEIARKSCGTSAYWHWKLETLHEVMGSSSTLKEFRRMMKEIIEANQNHDHIPDYTFELDDDLVKIRPRAEFLKLYREPEKPPSSPPRPSERVVERVRDWCLEKGWDYYALENDWGMWSTAKDREPPDNVDGAFTAFAKKWLGNRGSAR